MGQSQPLGTRLARHLGVSDTPGARRGGCCSLVPSPRLLAAGQGLLSAAKRSRAQKLQWGRAGRFLAPVLWVKSVPGHK